MREPCTVSWSKTPIIWRTAQANMLSISQMPSWRRQRLVMENRPRPLTGMVMRIPPISTCVTTENTRPTPSSMATAASTSFRPGSTNT